MTYLLCFLAGGFCGVLIMALCVAAGRADEHQDQIHADMRRLVEEESNVNSSLARLEL